MSADNIIYVDKDKGRWHAWEQSASCDAKIDYSDILSGEDFRAEI